MPALSIKDHIHPAVPTVCYHAGDWVQPRLTDREADHTHTQAVIIQTRYSAQKDGRL